MSAHSARTAATSTPAPSAIHAATTKVSRTALPFHAEKNAMAAAIRGGSSAAPSRAARVARAQLHTSRRNVHAAQLAAIASTTAGPANANSST